MAIVANLSVFRSFVKRELRETFAASVLGTGWVIAQPVLQVLVFWLVFSKILKLSVPLQLPGGDPVPFIAFLLSALLPWFAFQDALFKGTGAIASRGAIIKRLPFPSWVFAFSSVTAPYLLYAVALLAFLLYWLQVFPVTVLQLAALLWIYLMQWLASLGLGLALASLNVFLRDLSHVIGLVAMILLYSAPILYTLDSAPESIRGFLYLNPFTVFAQCYHVLLLSPGFPDIADLLWLTALTALLHSTGFLLYNRLKPGFPEAL